MKNLLQQAINYIDMRLPRDRRQMVVVPSDCTCYICLVGSDKTRKPLYKKNNIGGKIVKGKGFFGHSKSNKILSLKTVDNRKSSNKKITTCVKCMQRIGRGKCISVVHHQLIQIYCVKSLSFLRNKKIRLQVKLSTRMLQIQANQT